MGHHPIVIITDTTCDIPDSLVEQYDIRVMAHTLIWHGQQYRDRVDLQPAEFYERLAVEKELPTTSQISVMDFAQEFRKQQEEGAQEIIVFTVSGEFSGTIQSARQAAAMLDIPVCAVDSKTVTMSLGFQVLAAARARAAGADSARILAAAEQVRRCSHLYVSMDTLEYLHRGGRIGNARHLVGSMMNIKPLVYIDHTTGMVEPAGVSFTHRKVVEMMCQKFFEQMDPQKPLHLAVMHGNIETEALELAENILRQYHPVELVTHMTGPALGVNTGPRALALAGYNEE
jgi:DegV family protein with EDD domain